MVAKMACKNLFECACVQKKGTEELESIVQAQWNPYTWKKEREKGYFNVFSMKERAAQQDLSLSSIAAALILDVGKLPWPLG